MPVTIDNLGTGIYIQYARRTELIEQVRMQYHLSEAGQVPAEALLVDLYPKLSELDLLLGVAAMAAPWAYFYAPKNYAVQRRSTFAFHMVAPIFGSLEKEEEEARKLEEFECSDPDEETEKSTLLSCMGSLKKINELIRFVGGRIGQFLQG